jgi:tetratricopeptide (TPR) repeat protein
MTMFGRTLRHLPTLALLMGATALQAQTPPSYATLIAKGNELLQAGNLQAALRDGEAAIAKNSTGWEGYALKGVALMDLKQSDEAADALTLAIGRAPEEKKAALRDLRRQALTGAAPSAPSAPSVPEASVSQAEVVLWKSIENSENQKDFNAYLAQYPNGAFAALARTRASDLAADHGERAYRRGMDQTHNKNYVEANASLQLGCDNGSVAACVELGREYNQGLGVSKDFARAAELERKACDNANTNGCFWLGVFHARGEGVTQDYAKAAQLFQKSCDDNNLAACNNLGFAYANGDMGVAQDLSHAIALYQKTCDGGQPTGCANLAHMYNKGLGVAKDNAVAKQLRQRACSLGDNSECGS